MKFIFNTQFSIFNSRNPLWEKYYSWTPYQYAACNPVTSLDDNGKWVKEVSKESHIHSGTVSRNNNGYLANKINYEFYDNWKQNAPKVASFIEKNSIFVLQSKLEENTYGEAIRGGNKMEFDLDKKQAFEKLEMVALHEIVHLDGYGEFGALSAMLAAGYDIESMVKSLINSGNPESQSKVFDNSDKKCNEIWDKYLNGEIDTDGIIDEMKKYGETIIK